MIFAKSGADVVFTDLGTDTVYGSSGYELPLSGRET
jgi:hypothetical protein